MRSFYKSIYGALAATIVVSPLHSAVSDPPVTIVFQNGLNDYQGAAERRIGPGYVNKDGILVTGNEEFYVDGGAKQLNDSGFGHAMMRFDNLVGPNAIPTGSKILNAKLTVIQKTHGNAHSPDTFTVFRLTRPFDSSSSATVTTDNPNPDFGTDGIFGDVDWVLGSFRASNVAGNAAVVSADVTRAVQSWVDGSSPNYGVGIAAELAYNGWSFNTSGSAQALRPKLEVTYVSGSDVQAKDFQSGLNGYDGLTDITVRTNGATVIGKNVGNYGFDAPTPGTDEPDIPGLMRFAGPEFDSLVNGRKIEKATLRLFTTSTSSSQSGGPFTVHRLLVPFTETTNREDFAPSTGEMIASGQIGPALGSFRSIAQFQVMAMDVTAAAKEWAAGEPNHGLYIASGTPDAWGVFSSGAWQIQAGNRKVFYPERAPELTIVSSPPLPIEITAPLNDSRYTIGTPVTFQVNTTLAAPATVEQVEFILDGKSIGIDTSAPYTFNYSGDKLGNFKLVAKLKDSTGREIISDQVQFSVIPPTGSGGLYFDGLSDHVALGDPAELKLSTFTVETWFRREARGVTTTTGSGGVVAIPLVAKGRDQTENSTLDTNWFLGIRDSDGTLMADFEGAGGVNFPITGVTKVPYSQWNHAAMTFDGTYFRLYLNGSLEQEVDTKGVTPRADSIQHASIATAMNSDGLAEGAFGGYMDEIRIWNVARSDQQIREKINSEVVTDSGLVARWGMTEGSGTTITSSSGNTISGNFGGLPTWTSGMIFNNNVLPSVVFTAPVSESSYQYGDQAAVQVTAADPDGSVVKVDYYDNGLLTHTATTSPFSFQYVVKSGNRVLTAVVTDNMGGTSRSLNSVSLSSSLPMPTVPGYSAGLVNGGDAELGTLTPPQNPAPWEIVATTAPPLAFVSPGTISGDIAVRINNNDVPYNSGIVLTTNCVINDNKSAIDNLAAPYAKDGKYRVANWDNNGPGELNPVTSPESSSFSMGFFPYANGWIGGNVAADGSLMPGSGGLPDGVVITNNAVGSYQIAGLPSGGNLIVIASGENSDDYASAGVSRDIWTVLLRDNNEKAENASFSFLYIPSSSRGIMSGMVAENGNFTALNPDADVVGVVSRRTAQGYELTFGDGDIINPTNTALFVSPDANLGPGADNAYSYSASGNSFVVFSHDLPGFNGVLQGAGFRFMAVPLNPHVPASNEVAVKVTKGITTESPEDNSLIFTVSRIGSTTSDLNVNYSLTGTATSGSDYIAMPGMVTIPAGKSSATVTITVLEDVLLEQDETVIITLLGGGPYTPSAYSTATGIIRNSGSSINMQTVTFQEGVNGYTGQTQRRVSKSRRLLPDGSQIDEYTAQNGDVTDAGVPVEFYPIDGGNPDSSDMMRFDHIIGSGPNKIPSNAKIIKAELTLTTHTVADSQTSGPYNVGRLTKAFSRTTVYTDLDQGPGMFEGVRGGIAPSPSAGFPPVVQGGTGTADVTSIIRAWVAGEPNHGFALFSGGTTDAWNYGTVGNTDSSKRPKLEVTYTTEVLQEFKLTANQSAIISSKDGSNTVDGAAVPVLGYLKAVSGDSQEAMMKFPVVFDNEAPGAIPLDREIVKAELVIRTGDFYDGPVDAYTNGVASIHQIITPWSPTSSYGANGPVVGVDVLPSAATGVGLGVDTVTSIDVTSIVRNWRAGQTNHGFNIKMSNSNNWGIYFPGSSNAAYAPYLRIITTTNGVQPVEEPFDLWAASFGVAGIARDSDEDHDGLSALMEYALGFNPKSYNTLPGIVRNGSNVSISFQKGSYASTDSKISYHIMSSENLVDWTEETTATQDSSSITFNLPSGEAKKFYRLKVIFTP